MFSYGYLERIVLPFTLIFMIASAFAIFICLKDKDEKTKSIPLAIITVNILLLEIIKQVRAIATGYDWWTFPMHFCSLFIYILPIATFAKGKLKNFGQTTALVCCILLTICFYFSPKSIIGSSSLPTYFTSWDSFHTVTFHHLAIFYGFVTIALNMPKIDKKSYLYVLIAITVYAAVAIPLANLTNTNYCNLLHTDIAILEKLRINFGQVIYLLTLYLIGVLGGCLICKVYSLFHRKNYGVVTEKETITTKY